MHYEVFSFSHKTADITIREKLSILDENNKKSFLSILVAHDSISEVILLNTCNRTEIILCKDNPQSASDFIFHELSYFCKIKEKTLLDIAEIYKDKKAIVHIFNVASSLESVVVGETQITGQLKEAYRFSMGQEFCSKNLSKVIHFAIKCASRVRNETQISKDKISVASVAIGVLKKQGIHLDDKRVLIIGAGDFSQLALKYFTPVAKEVILVNRSMDRAILLQEESKHKFTVKRFENLASLVNEVDIIFSATSAPTPVITKEMIKKVDFPRYWLDMAVPQDIETIQEDAITVYNMDTIKEIIETSKDHRQHEKAHAQLIVDEAIQEYFEKESQFDALPTIKSLQQKAQHIYKDELQYAIKRGYLGKEQEEVVQKMLDRAFQKFLHEPFVGLKKVAHQKTNSNIGDTIDYLFNYDNSKSLLFTHKD